MGIYGVMTGKKGKSGFGSASTAEDVTQAIDASHLTAIITGSFIFPFPSDIFLQTQSITIAKQILFYVYSSCKTFFQKKNRKTL
jgi:hypothetical protein